MKMRTLLPIGLLMMVSSANALAAVSTIAFISGGVLGAGGAMLRGSF